MRLCHVVFEVRSFFHSANATCVPEPARNGRLANFLSKVTNRVAPVAECRCSASEKSIPFCIALERAANNCVVLNAHIRESQQMRHRFRDSRGRHARHTPHHPFQFMRAWRIAAARHAKAPPDGEGSRLFGGRWSSVGVRVAYASESIALAVLETLVHYDTDTIPDDLVLIAVDIPDAVPVETLAGAVLPRNWRAYQAPAALQMPGNAWVKRARTAVFNTPSALVPEERNLLINPADPDFAKINSRTLRPFAFDPRMFAGR